MMMMMMTIREHRIFAQSVEDDAVAPMRDFSEESPRSRPVEQRASSATENRVDRIALLCGLDAPEWMRRSEICIKRFRRTYDNLGAQLVTARTAHKYRKIFSAGAALASSVLAGAGVVACVGTCGQLCPGPTGVAGLAATAAASATKAYQTFSEGCEECEEIERKRGTLMNDGGFTKGMSAEARSEANEMFDLLDEDQDGFITFEELESASIELGETPDPEEIREIVRSADITGDEKLERIEFVISMHRAGEYEYAEAASWSDDGDESDACPVVAEEPPDDENVGGRT